MTRWLGGVKALLMMLLCGITHQVNAIASIDIQCRNGQLIVVYELEEGDLCTGQRIEVVNGEVQTFELDFVASRTRPTRVLSGGDVLTVNGFLECTNEATGVQSNVSSGVASLSGCRTSLDDPAVVEANIANTESAEAPEAVDPAAEQNNRNTSIINLLESANSLEAATCAFDGNSTACESARSASNALRSELGILNVNAN